MYTGRCASTYVFNVPRRRTQPHYEYTRALARPRSRVPRRPRQLHVVVSYAPPDCQHASARVASNISHVHLVALSYTSDNDVVKRMCATHNRALLLSWHCTCGYVSAPTLPTAHAMRLPCAQPTRVASARRRTWRLARRDTATPSTQLIPTAPISSLHTRHSVCSLLSRSWEDIHHTSAQRPPFWSHATRWPPTHRHVII